MGQAVRMMSYDRAANERNAVTALHAAGHPLSWFRLDDGVMGGKSETKHQHLAENNSEGFLRFTGTIDTNGGGFASIRAKIPPGALLVPSTTSPYEAIRIQYRGDGKTYKVLMSDGNRMTGAPFSRTPSWQVDLPTTDRLSSGTTSDSQSDAWDVATIPLSSMVASFGGSARQEETSKYQFDPSEIREVGIMLSLRLANGDPNPKETFGEGVFPFQLHVKSIEPVPPPAAVMPPSTSSTPPETEQQH